MFSVVLVVGATGAVVIGGIVRLLGHRSYDRTRRRRERRKK